MSLARPRYPEVMFQRIGPNHVVPMQPWPQTFYVSGYAHRDAFVLRPLTFTGLIKGVGRNFVTMMFWRLCWTLRCLGFLTTRPECLVSWRDLTFRFWRYQQVNRFRWVRRLRLRLGRDAA